MIRYITTFSDQYLLDNLSTYVNVVLSERFGRNCKDMGEDLAKNTS